jgi:hypothetical protein
VTVAAVAACSKGDLPDSKSGTPRRPAIRDGVFSAKKIAAVLR